jgi:hypothetical protein
LAFMMVPVVVMVAVMRELPWDALPDACIV